MKALLLLLSLSASGLAASVDDNSAERIKAATNGTEYINA